LGGSNLRGETPAWLAIIKTLELLDLSYNQVTGTVPDWVGTLPSSFYLDLSINLHSGELPIQFSRPPALTLGQIANKLKGSHIELLVFMAPSNASRQQYSQLASLPPAINLRPNITGNIPVQLS